MEDVSVPVQDEEEANKTVLIELFDIILTDGTHLRLCTDSRDREYLDYLP